MSFSYRLMISAAHMLGGSGHVLRRKFLKMMQFGPFFMYFLSELKKLPLF